MVRKKDSSTCHHRSDPAVRTGKILCSVHVKIVDVKESKQSGHSQNLWDCKNESVAESPRLERELLRRIMKELSGGKARRARFVVCAGDRPSSWIVRVPRLSWESF